MKKLLAPLSAFAVLILPACVSQRSSGTYHVKALRPQNPDAIRVKISLSKQNIYVLEGNRLLMAAATCVGTAEKPTPKGTFRITSKIEQKRSNSYGFFVNGATIVPGEAARPQPGKFVGYPMGYWCEFAPAYGIHTGYVHPVPRTHGCLRLHKDAAPKFFALVKVGTPVSIADEQPEDTLYASRIARPNDYLDPDPAPEFMVSPLVFEKPKGELLADQ